MMIAGCTHTASGQINCNTTVCESKDAEQGSWHEISWCQGHSMDSVTVGRLGLGPGRLVLGNSSKNNKVCIRLISSAL